MAKVYEAMVLAQDTVPEATRQFLTDYNFSEVVPRPEYAMSESDPFELAEFGLEVESPSVPDSVARNVAVAEAIADSVSFRASSLQPEAPAAPVAPLPPLQPVSLLSVLVLLLLLHLHAQL